jgi:hypothetical protein
MLRILQKSVMVESLSFLPLITAARATGIRILFFTGVGEEEGGFDADDAAVD